jgi:hypothetical protein
VKIQRIHTLAAGSFLFTNKTPVQGSVSRERLYQFNSDAIHSFGSNLTADPIPYYFVAPTLPLRVGPRNTLEGWIVTAFLLRNQQ